MEQRTKQITQLENEIKDLTEKIEASSLETDYLFTQIEEKDKENGFPNVPDNEIDLIDLITTICFKKTFIERILILIKKRVDWVSQKSELENNLKQAREELEKESNFQIIQKNK